MCLVKENKGKKKGIFNEETGYYVMMNPIVLQIASSTEVDYSMIRTIKRTFLVLVRHHLSLQHTIPYIHGKTFEGKLSLLEWKMVIRWKTFAVASCL